MLLSWVYANHSLHTDDSTSKYVRDPDDEDTLSPVMVPIASPDSSCHSNNNFDSDLNETPTERILTFNLSNEIEKKNEGGLLRTAVPIAPPPVKRPRSPTSNQVCFPIIKRWNGLIIIIHQVVSVAAPLPKIRAVSPSCVRPQHRITAPSQPIFSQGPRGSAVPIIRPPAPIHLTNHSPAPFGKVRIRPPVVSANIQRATVRPAPPQNTLVNKNSSKMLGWFFTVFQPFQRITYWDIETGFWCFITFIFSSFMIIINTSANHFCDHSLRPLSFFLWIGTLLTGSLFCYRLE